MDADHTNHDHARVTIAERWRMLPWWERVLYVLATLLLVLAVGLNELLAHAPVAWFGTWTLYSRLMDMDALLFMVGCAVLVASVVFTTPRITLSG